MCDNWRLNDEEYLTLRIQLIKKKIINISRVLEVLVVPYVLRVYYKHWSFHILRDALQNHTALLMYYNKLV